MSLLDDPALVLPPRQLVTTVGNMVRVRFRGTSTFAREMGLMPGCVGVVTARYSADGCDRVNIQIEDGPYCCGLLVDEIMPEHRQNEGGAT